MSAREEKTQKKRKPEKEEINFEKESNKLVKFLIDFKVEVPAVLAIDLIRQLGQHRPGEDYGSGDGCYNTDCCRDFPFHLHIEKDDHKWCPDCHEEDDEEDVEVEVEVEVK